MDIEHRISTTDSNFRCLLDSNNIKYKISGTDSVVLTICESDVNWPLVKEYIVANKILSIVALKFSKAEMDAANWFVMRSTWRWEYPMPDNNGGYKEIVYNTEKYCEHCGVGLAQHSLFRLRKAPNWNKKNFLVLNWVEDELFVSGKAKELLTQSKLKGFEFLDVLKYKKETKLDDIYQLKIKGILPSCFIPRENEIKNEIKCSECGNVKWVLNGKGYSFDENVLNEDFDIIKTSESFGAGAYAAKKILVSKKFYEILKENKLDSGLLFIPINSKLK